MVSTATKLFIIDESVMMRFALTQLLSQNSEVLVVGSGAPGSTGLDKQIKATDAEILLVDLPNVRKEGRELVASLRKLRLPVVVFAPSNEKIAQDLIPLLEVGAVAFVLKPEHETDLSSVRDQLLYEIKRNQPQSVRTKKTAARPLSGLAPTSPARVVAIGSSTGGPEALETVLGMLPEDFPAGVVIVQHMPGTFTAKFAERMNRLCKLPVKEAAEGDVIRQGEVLIARGDYHLVFQPFSERGVMHARAKLTLDPPQWKLRPTVDMMMTSLVSIYGKRMMGVILTGMGQDGVIGMRALKKAGGHTLVQNKETSVVYGMAQEVVKNNLADEVLPLAKLVPRLIDLLKEGA